MAEISFTDVLIALVLVAFSGLFSGLTLGLLGLDVNGLKIAMSSNDPKVAYYAQRIMPIRKNGNLLLCTLLLGNVAVNAALSIILSNITSGLVGGFLSTGLIVIFGEIIPQAVCSRYALSIGSRVVPLVWLLIALMFIVSYPIAKILDCVLGDELGAVYDKKELQTLLKMHEENEMAELRKEEAAIMSGALNYADKYVDEVMTPIEKVFALDISAKLDFKALTEIFKRGFSRIPCFDRSLKRGDRIVGILLVKDLILVDPQDEMDVETILNVYGREVPAVFPDTPLGDLLTQFKTGSTAHLAVVRDVVNDGVGDPYYTIVGIITLEDILEVILQDNIVDETDIYIDVNTGMSVQRGREFDLARLNIFNSYAISQQHHTKLSEEEGLAVLHHLSGTQQEFAYPSPIARELLEELLYQSEILICDRSGVEYDFELGINPLSTKFFGVPTPQMDKEEEVMEALDISNGGWSLYQRGYRSSYVSLILEGKAMIRAGSDGFESVVGCWSILGKSGLRRMIAASREYEDEEEFDFKEDPALEKLVNFKPDFSAFAMTSCRVLRIPREAYFKAVLESRGQLGDLMEYKGDEPDEEDEDEHKSLISQTSRRESGSSMMNRRGPGLRRSNH